VGRRGKIGQATERMTAATVLQLFGNISQQKEPTNMRNRITRKGIARVLAAGAFLASAIAWQPLVAQAAGDASAIRRATRTEDSRWVSNYRPGSSSNYRSGSHKSTYRRYSANTGRSTAAVKPSTAQQSVPVTAQAPSKAQAVSKNPAH
jgi:hypothetical protein